MVTYKCNVFHYTPMAVKAVPVICAVKYPCYVKAAFTETAVFVSSRFPLLLSENDLLVCFPVTVRLKKRSVPYLCHSAEQPLMIQSLSEALAIILIITINIHCSPSSAHNDQLFLSILSNRLFK
ncbi:hypothetical protein XELAEV_18009044mg [Xenopus laevis]|uniref:Uncharacterized protein n=1 Tax=Xenopus laevis TaxID=8355 RepID=A0A974I070_XENLA|nr:hypothetical protein XELAEV_18009044mg [Xenopus laevis]